MAPRAILIGAPGAGKSTVGRLLAGRLGVEFVDTDARIEAEAGQAISDIFVEHGEAHFRALERAAVVAELASGDGVLALGGGAILDPDTRADLRDHAVVFLDVELADAARRVGLDTTRPLLLGNVRGRLKQLMDARRPLYREVATWRVETGGRTPAELVELIAVELLPVERA